MITQRPWGKLHLAEDERARSSSREVPRVPGHRQLLEGDFWRRIPAYRGVMRGEFVDYRFQLKHTITRADQLSKVVQDLAPKSFYEDVADGLARSPMSFRVSPHLLSLIDWDDPY